MRRTTEMFARSTARCDSTGIRANSIVAVRNVSTVLPTLGAVRFVAYRKSMLLRVSGKRARDGCVDVDIFLDGINVRVAAHVRAGASVVDRFDRFDRSGRRTCRDELRDRGA
ncbi:hypothetical protein [Burkholderia multivorans]|uniref:hypothetical protein n=1 Tax=Burkholderia multivorans TaxID=87883 RepID=UPI0037355E4B